MRLLVDARVGWGHGIGRVIANTLPRIAAARPDWRIEALVGPEDMAAAEAALGGLPNLSLSPCDIAPFSLAEQRRLRARAEGVDLTWFTNYWVPLNWRGPFVATVHDMLHLNPEYFPASLPKRTLSRRTFAKVRHDARSVLFVSRFTQGAFHRMIGTPRAEAVVHLGGDHLDYREHPRPIAQRSRRLLVVAASKRHKNFALLLDAWNQARLPEGWRLTIVSPDGPTRSSIDLDGLIASAARVDVRRGVSNAELAELYADSAVLLMPSLYEGFGLPLLEGMLAGALCVSANAGAMVEVAQGGFVQFVNGDDRAGWTTAIEQACAMIERGQPDLDPLLRHNAAQAQRFRWDATAEAIADALAAACGQQAIRV